MDTKSKVEVKAKSDPEALLNGLSASLKSFQSTVRTWTANASPAQTSTQANSSMEMRPARLGLGAKAERKAVPSDSVAGNLVLKKQLTGTGNRAGKICDKQSFSFKEQKGKRREFEEEAEGGRASMLKSKRKK